MVNKVVIRVFRHIWLSLLHWLTKDCVTTIAQARKVFSNIQ